MARATATIRQLKNKDTGIDLAVTSIKEVKALIGSGYEYEVMVVSNLACFKNAKHKETDNVQFTVQKKFSEFEDLYTKLNTKYTGTVFPQLPRKVIKVSAQVAKDRRQDLDQFLKFMAMTDKLSSCPLLLEFLGVSSVKAGNFRKSETLVVSDREKTAPENEVTVEEDNTNTEEDLFDEDNVNNDDDDLFSDQTANTDAQGDTKIFDDVDLGGALDEEEEDSGLFVPDARTEVKHPAVMSTNDEDNEDLFNIDNDLDDLVKLSMKPTGTQTEEVHRGSDKMKKEKPVASKKPSLPGSKPELINENPETITDSTEEAKKPRQKPNIPNKPKPALPQKPGMGQKPSVTRKPELKPKPVSVSEGKVATSKGDIAKETEDGANLNEDDILKYIQENNANNDEDLDLFS